MINVCIIDADEHFRAQQVKLIRKFFDGFSTKVEIDILDNKRNLPPEMWEECAYDLAMVDISDKDTRDDVLKYSVMARKHCQKTKIIFTSSDPMASLDVFRYSPDYFIYKQELYFRITEALGYLFKLKKINNGNNLLVITKSTKYIIPTGSILYFEHYQHDTRIVCEDREILCHEKLSDLLDRLSSERFLRCHCSFVINLDHVKEYTRTQIIIDDGRCIPCSRTNSKALKEAMERLKNH